MQVSVIHMLNHILHKQNPLYLFHIQLFPYRFFKWGALFLALLSTYRIVVAFRRKAHSKPLLGSNDDDDDDYDFSDTDDDSDDETVSTSDSEDDNLEGEEEEEDDKAKDRRGKGAYFQVSGGGSFLRRRSIADIFSLSEIANVKLGLGLGLGFDSEEEEESVVLLYNHFKTTTALSSAAPAVVVSAGEKNALGMRIWDARVRRRMPAVIAEWGPAMGENVGVESNGEHKVYVKDDGRYGLTVGDIRNVRFPLENVTELYVDAWWPNSFMLKLQ